MKVPGKLQLFLMLPHFETIQNNEFTPFSLRKRYRRREKECWERTIFNNTFFNGYPGGVLLDSCHRPVIIQETWLN